MSSYGLWLSAAGMQVNQHRQTVLANNMANIDTTAFKQDLAMVSLRPVESQEDVAGQPFMHSVLDGMSGGLEVKASQHDFSQGAIEGTGRPLDMAIAGAGFFTVSDGSATRYTRDGSLSLNRGGELVLSAGGGRWRVLDEGGARILVEPGRGQLSVSQSGVVRQGKEEIARIGLVKSKDATALRKVGGNLFELTGGEMVRAGGRIEKESLERSNFDAMRGLAQMIEASRAYELNANMVRMQDDLTGQAISRVGRVA